MLARYSEIPQEMPKGANFASFHVAGLLEPRGTPQPPLCVEMGFTRTFPRNQDVKVKLKSELISIKF